MTNNDLHPLKHLTEMVESYQAVAKRCTAQLAEVKKGNASLAATVSKLKEMVEKRNKEIASLKHDAEARKAEYEKTVGDLRAKLRQQEYDNQTLTSAISISLDSFSKTSNAVLAELSNTVGRAEKAKREEARGTDAAKTASVAPSGQPAPSLSLVSAGRPSEARSSQGKNPAPTLAGMDRCGADALGGELEEWYLKTFESKTDAPAA